MTKAEMEAAIAGKMNCSKADAIKFLESFEDVVRASLKEGFDIVSCEASAHGAW